jgi:hypothetical protein
MPVLTPQQTTRRNEFTISLRVAITKIAHPVIGRTDQHMSENCIRDWNAGDWPDLPDDVTAHIAATVTQIRTNIQAFANQSGNRRENNANLTFLMYGEIIKLLEENGIQVFPNAS